MTFVIPLTPAVVVLAFAYTASAALAALTVRLSPSDCGHSATGVEDCGAAIAAAVARCRAAPPPCTIALTSGAYRISCPMNVSRPSAAQVAFPAISLDNVASLTFGGDGNGARPQLLVDYAHYGCAAITVANASNVLIHDVVIDAYRLPFSVGTILSANASVVSFTVEDDEKAEGRVGTYAWDTLRYPWLDNTLSSQPVVAGSRATRQLPSLGMESNADSKPLHPDGYTSSVDASGRVVTFVYQSPLSLRAKIARGTRIFLKHFSNEQSWGIHGVNVRGSLRIERATLLSISGMGFRADFCDCAYDLIDSSIEIKHRTLRPMSITADGTHWMHHAGPITLRNTSVQGQGDDGFNIHGNFIMVVKRLDAHSVEYIDERGSGWIHAAPTKMIGDAIAFYSRRTLQRLSRNSTRSTRTADDANSIVWANASVVRFANPLPPALKRFDMFLSLKRTASLVMEDCFFGNSNSRGVVLSAVNATIRRNRFANLSNDGVVIIEGGCGCKAGDYTEGPFSKNVLIANNTFDRTSTVNNRKSSWNPENINNIAALQITGCVPIGVCGSSGGELTSVPPIPSTLDPGEGSTLRIVAFTLPGGVRLTRLRYYVHGRRNSGSRSRSRSKSKSLKGSVMAIYSSIYDSGGGVMKSCDHPTKRLGIASNFTRDDDDDDDDDDAADSDSDGWWSAPLTTEIEGESEVEAETSGALTVTNGTYFLAFVYAAGETWLSAKAKGVSRFWKEPLAQFTRDPLPSDLVDNYTLWTNSDSGVAIAAAWSPVGDWCDVGGTLPPPFTPNNAADPIHGWDGGHLTEPGNVLDEGRTFARNISIVGNVFIAPKDDPFDGVWGNNFLHLGGVDGLTVQNNTMVRRAPFVANLSAADVVHYSNKALQIEDNRCGVLKEDVVDTRLHFDIESVPCRIKDEAACNGVVNKC